MQFAIGEWSKKELPIWEKVREMETAEYKPQENYDRYDNEIESTDRERQNEKHDVINNDSKATSAEVVTSTDTERVAGFNTDTL